MAALVSSVVTRIQRAFPECDSTTALDYINEVHSVLLSMFPFIKTTEDITLVAGTQEYALNELTLRVWSAEYFASATDHTTLQATEKSLLDATSPNWRRIGNGRPRRMFIDRNATDNTVGFIPTPITATSGTYPFVRLYVSRGQTLLIGDSLPKSINTEDTYTFGACWRFTLDKKRSESDYWYAKFKGAMDQERGAMFGRNVLSKPMIMPDWYPRGGLV